jgi:cytochrome P450
VRVVSKDTELGGHRLKKGDALSLYLAAANRDPDIFPEPDTFQLMRDRRRQIPFGHGIHFCVGAGLARLEGTSMLEALLGRFPNMRIAQDWEPLWTRYPQSRMLDTLPITWSASA